MVFSALRIIFLENLISVTWNNVSELIQQIKDHPHPNKNSSYGIEGGVRMPCFGGPYAIFSVEIPSL